MKNLSKVLVTGGAGFIGSHVVDLLISQGYQVVILDNLVTGQKENINKKATFYQIDINDSLVLNKIFAKERPSFIIHLAAQINVRASVLDPIYDAGVNILGTLNLLELAKKYKVKKFVYSSSGGCVYGEPKYLPVKETHANLPESPYGISKFTVEHYLNYYQKTFGLNYTILRYSNVYGPRQNPKGEAGVIAIFIDKMLKGETVSIFGSGRQTRDFVYVSDVAKANLFALQKNTKNKIFNIGVGAPSSVLEIHKLLKQELNIKTKPKFMPAIAGELKHIYLDNSRAKKELGWRPSVHLKQGIKATVIWSKNAKKVKNEKHFWFTLFTKIKSSQTALAK